MATQLSISVIIPTYNRRELLKRALASIFAQTAAPKEVIVVDDGSSDNTGEMIQAEFPEATYIYQENKGVSAARNAAISRATGKWIAFLDSDDEWLPEKLATQNLHLTDQPDFRICHTNEIWIRNGKRVNQMKKHRKFGGDIFLKCLPLCAISPSTALIHRDVFSDIGLFDESLPACEDYDLWLRICAKYPVLYIDEPLIRKYGGHEDQLSQKYWGMDRFRIKALENILKTAALHSDYRRAVLEMILNKIKIYIKGAEKRHKLDAVAEYEQKKQHYEKELATFL